MANKDANRSLRRGGRRRQKERDSVVIENKNYYCDNDEADLNLKLAKSNIYESIIDQTPIKQLNRQSSSSTSKLYSECRQRLLPEEGCQKLHQSNDQLLRLSPSNNNTDDDSIRRRDPNDIDSNQLNITTNPYSEISTTPVPFTDQTTTNTASHYQVPTYAIVNHHQPSGLVKDEMEQLIENKRKRTLLLLRLKEAPKASIELTSPLTEDAEDLRLVSSCSDYDNLSSHQQQQQRAANDPLPEIELQDSIISPSETSQNLNTLSLVSDVLDIQSQEPNSLVQQLSRG